MTCNQSSLCPLRSTMYCPMNAVLTQHPSSLCNPVTLEVLNDDSNAVCII